MTVRDIDLGYRRIRRELRKLERAKVRFGFVQGKTPQEIIDRAAFNEFGTSRIPARPFVRHAMDNNAQEISNAQAEMVRSVIDGKANARRALDTYGRFMVELIRKSIDSALDWAAPLSPATHAQKGHAVPLVDTGAMRAAVTYVIEGL